MYGSDGGGPPYYGGGGRPPAPHGGYAPSVDVFLADYDRLLSELREFPDKNRITTLTMLAGENMDYAADVLGVLFSKMDVAPLPFQLPLLYVWDSILFNIGGHYVAESVPHVEPVFMRSYRVQDEGTRRKMCHVFNKWRERGTFGPRLLELLQSSMSAHDRAMLARRQNYLPPARGYAPPGDFPYPAAAAAGGPLPHAHVLPPPGHGHPQQHPPASAGPVPGGFPTVISSYDQAGVGVPPHRPLQQPPPPHMQPQQRAGPGADPGMGMGMPVGMGMGMGMGMGTGAPARPPSPPAEDGYLAVVNQLYGMPEALVSTDGFRFADRASMEAHNDWYMREKGREDRREAGKESRPWWVAAAEWVDLAPVDEGGDPRGRKGCAARGGGGGGGAGRSRSGHSGGGGGGGGASFDDSSQGDGAPWTPTASRGVTGVPVGDDADTTRRCAVCQEELQVKHADEEDCWVYADTVRPAAGQPHEGKIVHDYCLRDAMVAPTESQSPTPQDPRDARLVGGGGGGGGAAAGGDDANPNKRARR